MKCPLQLHAYHIASENVDIHDTECSRGECAWWSKEAGQCDPTGLIPWVQDLIRALDSLVDKMPTPPTIKR